MFNSNRVEIFRTMLPVLSLISLIPVTGISFHNHVACSISDQPATVLVKGISFQNHVACSISDQPAIPVTGISFQNHVASYITDQSATSNRDKFSEPCCQFYL